MAKRAKKRKTNVEGPKESGVLDKLDAAESASVLKALVDHHPELRLEAESLAGEVLGEVSSLSVADDVENAVLQFDYDDLNSRAGGHSWGYVEPTEAAWELLEEALEPFVTEISVTWNWDWRSSRGRCARESYSACIVYRTGGATTSLVGRRTSRKSRQAMRSKFGRRRPEENARLRQGSSGGSRPNSYGNICPTGTGFSGRVRKTDERISILRIPGH